jgi:hypothetical protein
VTVPLSDPKPPESRNCTFCGHADSEHAYSDNHAQPDWMNDDGSINYATHCHHPNPVVGSCLCPDMDGKGRPRAEGFARCLP